MLLPIQQSHVRREGARYALILLTFINMLSFADRYVISSVKELIKEDLNLSDAETALPATGMVFVYMVFAVIFGWISDKQLMDRRVLLATAVIFWSISTSLAGVAKNIQELVLLRSLIGVGEAAYATIVPPMIADFFPIHERNVAFGIFYVALPVGGALGYAAGGILGSAYGWRTAFLACGFPGLFAALLIFGIKNPPRSENDVQNNVTNNQSTQSGAINQETNSIGDKLFPSDSTIWLKSENQLQVLLTEFNMIISNRYFMICVWGQTANCFGVGGLADWLSSFLIRFNNSSVSEAGLIVGASTVIGGLMGNIIGAKVAEHYQHKIRNAFFLVPALFTIPAAIFLFFAINIPNSKGLTYFLIFLAQICMWTYIAPTAAIITNVIPSELRGRACGLQIFIMHILGDVISPPIIGALSDSSGSLKDALQITWITILLAGVLWFYGYYVLKPMSMTTSESTHNQKVIPTTFSELLGCGSGSCWSCYCLRTKRKESNENLIETRNVILTDSDGIAENS
eukprot:gene9591-19934_t